MSLTSQTTPLPRIELIGKIPPRGQTFCALCCMIYLGTSADDPDVQADLQALVKEAMVNGDDVIRFTLPERRDKILRIAVTTGLSTFFPDTPMPVCWVHMIPYGKVKNATPVGVSYEVSASPLIAARKGQVK